MKIELTPHRRVTVLFVVLYVAFAAVLVSVAVDLERLANTLSGESLVIAKVISIGFLTLTAYIIVLGLLILLTLLQMLDKLYSEGGES